MLNKMLLTMFTTVTVTVVRTGACVSRWISTIITIVDAWCRLTMTFTVINRWSIVTNATTYSDFWTMTTNRPTAPRIPFTQMACFTCVYEHKQYETKCEQIWSWYFSFHHSANKCFKCTNEMQVLYHTVSVNNKVIDWLIRSNYLY